MSNTIYYIPYDGVLDQGIYMITNKITGDRYIGKSSQLKSRLYKHAYKAITENSHLPMCVAIREHGVDNFITTIIDTEATDEREIYWIDKIKPEYNIAKGGMGGWINDQTGKRWKIKDTSKMGKARTGVPLSDEAKVKISSGQNYQSMYYIHTPWGVFETWKDASNGAKERRRQGNMSTRVFTDVATIKLYCEEGTASCDKKRSRIRWHNKTAKELGFYLVKKTQENTNEQ